ncbi:indolepyruvate ferredoxin oxidoreductase subunit alpha [Treponema rectale]|uniref:Indolepyruvate oxidoreductase subunit IorA n=1 Tax=Treponema rectale TaxID=744512 RepID=A0A840SEJ1_9SPIR|nr:indolepyruvate ferredoxin oxidoreductase subunit alpha [Treponema rectale]MBB5217882.1 indolepyruvate ferredoxin oxidoreductase alpha subunit [Treponema rectale]QOS40394.1 indolepyruvate ferredoxin oxidoreductase subunit alpha [Treponema rectale]
MSRQMIMGNQAIALGALKAGVKLAAGYPGTPSSEIIEFIAKYKDRTGTYVEWSVNEKAAAEVAAGASYAGSRTLVTMKQVGLNVASDPVMCLSYVGVKGGMVIVSADDPGPISSQTEQDTRVFASYSKLPCFDPSTPLEAFEMIQEAFELSEKYHTPVLLRPTTRVDHAYESMEFPSLEKNSLTSEFEKDTNRWVIFPRSSYLNHKRIFDRNEHILPAEFSDSKWNFIEGNGKASTGVAAGGISWCYVKEAVSILKARYPESEELKNISFLKIGTPYPFPEKLAEKYLTENKRIVVFEELDPVIENALIHICGKTGMKAEVCGKADGTVPEAGELSVETVVSVLEKVFFNSEKKEESGAESVPELPVRPPVLCAGCPHRGSFYAVKQAMKGKKTAYCGDIGCYTLGNAKPLDMTDTCLCMGADITMAQGFYHNENDRHCFSFIGDSTFFASGITGVINGVYNQARQTVCVLDNSTTAMTGHQPHPGTGMTMMGKTVEKLSIKKILEAAGVNPVLEADPFNQEQAVAAVKQASEAEGVSAVIFKAPCIAVASKLGYKFNGPVKVQAEKCIGCQKCIRELGCPALSVSSSVLKNGKHRAEIDASLCTGCGLCRDVCPVKAIC